MREGIGGEGGKGEKGGRGAVIVRKSDDERRWGKWRVTNRERREKEERSCDSGEEKRRVMWEGVMEEKRGGRRKWRVMRRGKKEEGEERGEKGKEGREKEEEERGEGRQGK